MKRLFGLIVCLIVLCSAGGAVAAAEPNRPNVLMIAVDDLNDWVEPLGGHPLVKTPAMNRLAARGVTFTNAHCQATLCNPSRVSVMTGRRPTTTGVYGLSPWIRNVSELAGLKTIPQTFHDHGYHTLIGGKIHHGGYGRGPQAAAEADVWGPQGGPGVTPPQKLVGPTPGGNNPWVDWGVFDHRDEDKGDWKTASWAVEELQRLGKKDANSNGQPFFLSVGFFLPHVPCYVTQKWYDMYPGDETVVPRIVEGDRDDTPESSWYPHWHLPEPRTSWLRQNDQLINHCRSYLASISFMDSQIGRVLDALDASGLADSTIVVLWSDHGYHLGEKAISGKNSLWARSTRVPLIVSVPDGLTSVAAARGVACGQPVELLDVYPTLLSLAGLPADGSQEGHSLTPQLSDPRATREHPAITSHNPGNHSVCDASYRYIRYQDGSEELYDVREDPDEIVNLLAAETSGQVTAEAREVADRLAAWLPASDHPHAPGSAERILERRADGLYWEGKKIDPVQKME